MTDLKFKKERIFPVGTIKEYGRYGSYIKKEDGRWKRMKNGGPSFRKTINHKKMSEFLLEKGAARSFLETHGVKTLRSMIKSKGWVKEYRYWNEESVDG